MSTVDRRCRWTMRTQKAVKGASQKRRNWMRKCSRHLTPLRYASIGGKLSLHPSTFRAQSWVSGAVSTYSMNSRRILRRKIKLVLRNPSTTSSIIQSGPKGLHSVLSAARAHPVHCTEGCTHSDLSCNRRGNSTITTE